MLVEEVLGIKKFKLEFQLNFNSCSLTNYYLGTSSPCFCIYKAELLGEFGGL